MDWNGYGKLLESKQVITDYGVINLRVVLQPDGRTAGVFDLSSLPDDKARAFFVDHMCKVK